MNAGLKRKLVGLALTAVAVLGVGPLLATGKFWRMSQFGGTKVYFDPDTLATGQIIAHVTKDPTDASTLSGANLYSAYKAVDFPAQTSQMKLTTVSGDAGPGTTVLVIGGTANVSVNTQAFDKDTEEVASTSFLVPATMKATGTVTVKLDWTEGTAEASKAVVWKLKAIHAASGASIDVATVNVTVASDSSNSTATTHVAQLAPTVTTLGWAAGDLVHLFVSRDVSAAADNFGSDALLHGVSISVPIDPVQE